MSVASPALAPRDVRAVGVAAVGVPALVLLGYLGLARLEVSVAALGAMLFVLWVIVAFHRPRLALTVSLPVLLVAGTKFRLRDADASLVGLLDAQIVGELALFALIASGLLGVWAATRQRLRLRGAETIVAAYCVLAAASTLWSAAPALTGVRAIQLVVIAALAIVLVRVLAPSGALWTSTRAVALHVLACSALAATLPWASGALDYEEGVRFSWFAVHPIGAGTLAAAAALGLISVILFGPARGAPAKAGIVMPILATGLAVVLVLTGARGPMLAFVAGLAVLGLLRLRPAARIPAGLAAAAMALAAIGFGDELRRAIEAMTDQQSWLSRAFFRGQTADTLFSLNGRLGLWDDLRPAILAQPIAGYGYQGSRPVLLDAAAWAGYAHNAVLQTMLDLGALGAIALVAVVFTGLRAACRRARDPWTGAVAAALLAFLIVNSMATESFAGAPGFETLLLFVCVLSAGAAHASPAGAGAPA